MNERWKDEDAGPALFALLGLRKASWMCKSSASSAGPRVDTKMRSPSISGVSEALGLNDMALEREEGKGHSPGEH